MNNEDELSEIRHKWKQPLTQITALLMNIEIRAKIEKSLDVDKTMQTIQEVYGVIDTMNEELDNLKKRDN